MNASNFSWYNSFWEDDSGESFLFVSDSTSEESDINFSVSCKEWESFLGSRRKLPSSFFHSNGKRKSDDEVILDIQNGNKDLIDPFVRLKEPRIQRIAREVYLPNCSISLDHLIQDGRLGLFKAINHYEQKGFLFDTFATPFIRWAMIDHIRQSIGRQGEVRHFRLLQNTYDSMWQKNAWKAPSVSELAKVSGISSAECERFLDYRSHSIISLESFQEWKNDKNHENNSLDALFYEEFVCDQVNNILFEALEYARNSVNLSEREQIFLREHYGAWRDKQDIWRELGITKSWACRAMKKINEKLHKAMNEYLGKGEG